jgi:hypothetical protein
MYITTKGHSYYRGAEQRHSRAPFLILVQSKERELGPENFRALVRQVALQQCGHFMMGYARIKGLSIIISGSYGSDGLPISVPEEIYQIAAPVPKELYDAWNKGGGWNSSGKESEAMRKWAVKTFIHKEKI